MIAAGKTVIAALTLLFGTRHQAINRVEISFAVHDSKLPRLGDLALLGIDFVSSDFDLGKRDAIFLDVWKAQSFGCQQRRA